MLELDFLRCRALALLDRTPLRVLRRTAVRQGFPLGTIFLAGGAIALEFGRWSWV